jgi:uncharacterized protein
MNADEARATLESAAWQTSVSEQDRPMALASCILMCVVGSTVHGLAVKDGVEDLDVMGICCEPPDRVLGLRQFEHWVGRTQADGERSSGGDIDAVVYSLRKWARLAAQGNPTVLLPLYAPDDQLLVRSDFGLRLRAMADAFASRQAGLRFLGYSRAQRARLEGRRGQLRVHRPELVERYGFDTKFAGHLLRLSYQGVEYLETGRLTLPVPEPLVSHLCDVRLGRVPLSDVIAESMEVEARLEGLLETSPLPPYPDTDRIDAFLVETYTGWWRGSGASRPLR